MSLAEIPRVDILGSIEVANGGTGEGVLAYNGLTAAVQKYEATHGPRENAFWDSPQDSLVEHQAALEFAAEGLVRTAGKAVSTAGTESYDRWARLFTESSIEMYGAPDPSEAAGLIAYQQKWLKGLADREGVSGEHVDFLLLAYEEVVPSGADAEIVDGNEKEKAALAQYGETIRDKYQPIFDQADRVKSKRIDGKELNEVFASSLNWLTRYDDADWIDWKVLGGTGTIPNVKPGEKVIDVPYGSTATLKSNLNGLLAHEILTHALRSKNGYKRSPLLGRGLPGIEEIEEGFAILAEQAVSGKKLHRHRDRYIDISLALGILGGRQRTRQELFDIAYARWMVRSQAGGNYSSDQEASIRRKSWNRVDRIYRGGPGDSRGEQQAIFTKDIVYYSGYKKALGYLIDNLEVGKPAAAVFEFVSQAKFDPTNPVHIGHVIP
jgi:hypothetical protein